MLHTAPRVVKLRHIIERSNEGKLALAAMATAQAMGRRIPKDVSVIGFDDIELASEVTPPLTTMQIDKELMGGLAVRQLYERAANLDRPPITTMLGTRLIVRD